MTLADAEELRRAVAAAIVADGPVYAPLFERLEQEIAARRRAGDVMERAKALMEAK